MGLTDDFIKKIKHTKMMADIPEEYEYCPCCEANLTLQDGYRNELPVWKCLGCGEMLINPELDSETGIVWVCDQCGAYLNAQAGFREQCDEWVCTECGFHNPICEKEVYLSENEFQIEQKNPYRGLKDRDVLELLMYREVNGILEEEVPRYINNLFNGKDNVELVRHIDTQELFVKKILTIYDKSIYEYIKDHPVSHMPKIVGLYEDSNCLIVIEEYVKGKTLAEILERGPLPELETARIAKELCEILQELHNLDNNMPETVNLKHGIVHRDVKPSNVILTPSGEVWLLDLNVAKWHDPGKTDDTRYLGTQNYAAPEQVGFGMISSSPKTDIYAMGMLLNVMLTGRFPKEERATGRMWSIIEKCICLEAKERYTAEELMRELQRNWDS